MKLASNIKKGLLGDRKKIKKDCIKMKNMMFYSFTLRTYPVNQLKVIIEGHLFEDVAAFVFVVSLFCELAIGVYKFKNKIRTNKA